MLLDNQNLFSDSQAITESAVSDNVVQMSKGIIDEVSFGSAIPLLVQVVEDFAGATSLKVDIETSETSNFAQSKVLASSSAPAADLKAGFKFPIVFIPAGNLGYMRLKYTPEGTPTKGKITAAIVAGHDNSYQDM